MVNNLFPNIPSSERTKRISLESDALKYVEWYGDKAITFLEDKCKMCVVDGCNCNYPEIIKIIQGIDPSAT